MLSPHRNYFKKVAKAAMSPAFLVLTVSTYYLASCLPVLPNTHPLLTHLTSLPNILLFIPALIDTPNKIILIHP